MEEKRRRQQETVEQNGGEGAVECAREQERCGDRLVLLPPRGEHFPSLCQYIPGFRRLPT